MNKGNAQHAIVFEAIALALALDADTELLAAGVALLGKFIGLRDPNLKYLGLENMVRLAGVPAVMETVNRCAFEHPFVTGPQFYAQHCGLKKCVIVLNRVPKGDSCWHRLAD